MYGIEDMASTTVITSYGDRWVLDLSSGDHFLMSKNIESLCHTPETKIILYVDNNSIKKFIAPKKGDCKEKKH